MKRKSYFKCSKCNFEGSPGLLGTHYRENPTHRRAVLGRVQNASSNILEALNDPQSVVDAIGKKISSHQDEISNARRIIEQAETEITRLKRMRNYFITPGEVHEIKEA
jgi:hypothetical protein